jgi:hypothetical protein
MMAVALAIHPLPGAGLWPRLGARCRSVLSRRLLLRLVGVPTVSLEGRVYAVRAVPLGIARELVPALLRCSRRFAEWQIDEGLYDDFLKVLALGLNASPRVIDRLTVPLWELAPVVEQIARVNGLPMMEAGRSDLGKLLAAMMPSTGMPSSPGSSPAPAGPGSTSNNA